MQSAAPTTLTAIAFFERHPGLRILVVKYSVRIQPQPARLGKLMLPNNVDPSSLFLVHALFTPRPRDP